MANEEEVKSNRTDFAQSFSFYQFTTISLGQYRLRHINRFTSRKPPDGEVSRPLSGLVMEP